VEANSKRDGPSLDDYDAVMRYSASAPKDVFAELEDLDSSSLACSGLQLDLLDDI
jgi:hypothetical protein